MVIDDEPFVLRALDYTFSRAGYAVLTASDAAAGLELIRQEQPSVVILDVMLPLMTGYEVCERIKRDPVTRETCVVMLSARGEATDALRGTLSGANAYVTKPFSTRGLTDLIGKLTEA